ncbi:hypothetical protein L226DRAFT_576495 [Lentinus tigrinus ALCF2SS1-7]|uniref:CxC2-like cysteine cluster KDZ transposase-associated domain-containing protein n=1 Tax=Lentinus tigrinus ALCF2SS1-6 TaxID=1328759 RepID=A0A5C2RQS9_9APHY|nr:hypothetical protein L227DRAFT_617157 [Lentinus tigrinus ALCF2SS1-6]RPD68324.1 hypothetical protein L226DRAFT_576495 [Lentinus tigrinus ALCF2SS1-7]
MPRCKLRRLLTALPSLLCQMTKRRGKNVIHHNLNFDTSDDDDASPSSEAQARTETQKHIVYIHDSSSSSAAHRTSYIPIPLSPKKRARTSSSLDSGFATPLNDPDSTHSEEQEDLDLEYLYHRIETLDVNAQPRKRTAGDRPLLQWQSEVQTYLDELLRLEGRGDFKTPTCPECKQALYTEETLGYRCDDCDDTALYCQACTKERHLRHPFHRIKRWTGTHFEVVTLKSLGLRIQLGHRVGDKCYNPVQAFGDAFIVLDLHGIHEVALDFCGCETAAPSVNQLLRYRLYPATSTDPRTAATFRVLETFHLLSGQSKISAFEFYTTLARKTDNTGTRPLKDRYVSFLAMIRQWRHLKMLKRAGQGNVSNGALAVPSGSCAVECPACPHSDKNLPSDWKTAPPERSWLYRLYLAIDANFRLKRKKVSTDALDPSLNRGCAYFVEDTAYQAHIRKWDSDMGKDDLSADCNTHDAVKLANIKGASGLAATGIVTVDCSRHEMKRPCSIGNLQKGERQVNTDYILNSSLMHGAPTDVSVSYDVACSYSVRAPLRWIKYGFFTFRDRNIVWSIPMFHLAAHRERCRSVFSPYLLLYSGRLNGEGIERRWSMSNGYAPATKEMGPGSRTDLLDDVFGDQNWAKVTKLPAALLTRIKVAVVERSKHVNAYREFTASLPPDSVSEWKDAVVAWEASPATAANPYEYQRTHITQAALRLELAKEDALDIREGKAPALHQYYSSSTLVVVGMEIEDQQRKLLADSSALGAHPTDLQRAKILERQNALQRRIDGWRAIQELFMPGIATLIERPSHVDASSLPQNLPLLLPSTACVHIIVPNVLLTHEWRLRLAQAFDALTDLRGHLEVRAYVYRYKDHHVRGQRESLRSRDIVNGIEDKIKMDASRYCAAYSTLTTLSAALGKQDWRGSLQVLNDADIRHVAAGDGTGSEGRQEISWIWKAGSGDGNLADTNVNSNLQEGLRVEWCKARARALRWIEEVQILEEEMRRTVAYYDWHATWWEAHAGPTHLSRPEAIEGVHAYACRQASIRRRMREFCRSAWSCVRAWVCLGQGSSETFCLDEPLPADGSSADSDLPSLRTISTSSLELEREMEDVGEADMAFEDFD